MCFLIQIVILVLGLFFSQLFFETPFSTESARRNDRVSQDRCARIG